MILLVESDWVALDPCSGRSVEMIRSLLPPPPPPPESPLLAHAVSVSAAAAAMATSRLIDRAGKTPPPYAVERTVRRPDYCFTDQSEVRATCRTSISASSPDAGPGYKSCSLAYAYNHSLNAALTKTQRFYGNVARIWRLSRFRRPRPFGHPVPRTGREVARIRTGRRPGAPLGGRRPDRTTPPGRSARRTRSRGRILRTSNRSAPRVIVTVRSRSSTQPDPPSRPGSPRARRPGEALRPPLPPSGSLTYEARDALAPIDWWSIYLRWVSGLRPVGGTVDDSAGEPGGGEKGISTSGVSPRSTSVGQGQRRARARGSSPACRARWRRRRW